MAKAFTEEQIAEFHNTFSMFDTDGSGEISARELLECLRKLGQKSTLDEVNAMVNEVDVNGNGHVDFAEFLTMMANKFTGDDLEHEADEAFRNLFDRDGDGFINPKELKHVMATLGEELTDQEVAEMMIEADRDHDGLVSLAEFKAIILMKH